jgi:hypothetical protein
MKKTTLALTATAVFLFIVTSCKKVEPDVWDYYPKVRTISATVLSDGSVDVIGEIESEGDAPLEYAGFCASTDPVPAMTENEALVDRVVNNRFEVIYTGLESSSKFYFRTWATNKYGYTYGSVVSVDSIVATPVVAPCTPTMNSVNPGIGYPTDYFGTVSAPTQSLGQYEIIANATGVSMHLYFSSLPGTRIYSAAASASPGNGEVYVSFSQAAYSGSLNAGDSVYVNKTGASTWEITICSAPWLSFSTTRYLTTRFTCPL